MNGPRGSSNSPAATIRRKHAELLVTFRELAGELEGAPRGLHNEALRALVAFLRQGVLAFAHGEERALATDDEADHLGLEHAFLEAEIERLNQEAQSLLATWWEEPDRSWAGPPTSTDGDGWTAPDGPAGADRRLFDAVRRRVHRIEAVLELHTIRHDESVEPPSVDPFCPILAPAPKSRGWPDSTRPHSMTE